MRQLGLNVMNGCPPEHSGGQQGVKFNLDDRFIMLPEPVLNQILRTWNQTTLQT